MLLQCRTRPRLVLLFASILAVLALVNDGRLLPVPGARLRLARFPLGHFTTICTTRVMVLFRRPGRLTVSDGRPVLSKTPWRSCPAVLCCSAPRPRVRSLFGRDAFGSSGHSSVLVPVSCSWGHHTRCRSHTVTPEFWVAPLFVKLVGHATDSAVGQASLKMPSTGVVATA